MIDTLKRLILPVRFKSIYPHYKNQEFNLLDIGCGNHWPTKTKKWFNYCHYYGVDKDIYNNDENDMQAMDQFIRLDLSKDSLEKIPDNYFDVIMVVHLVEHLPNGLSLIRELTNKLKQRGKIYIEYPSIKSLSLPSMPGTLHFCDDTTHVRLYDLKEICNVLLETKCKIIKAGTRRNMMRIILTPLQFLKLRLQKLPYASAFCDISGFAEYVIAIKNDEK